MEQLELVNRSWGLYYHDYAIALSLKALRTRERVRHNVHTMDKFYAAAKAGTLPHFAFLEPRYSPDALHPKKIDALPNDQHPDNSVRRHATRVTEVMSVRAVSAVLLAGGARRAAREGRVRGAAPGPAVEPHHARHHL